MASVYSTVTNNGINPDMAAFFTGIAISMYCPSMMQSLGNGTFLKLEWLHPTRSVADCAGRRHASADRLDAWHFPI